jgi:polyhydroxyalkanoate synthesis regulator protein
VIAGSTISASRYVKLDAVGHMVRDGSHVRVVDARTGKDAKEWLIKTLESTRQGLHAVVK